MPNYLTESDVVLEWSADPLSDTTPTWTAVAVGEIQSLEWWVGIDREGDDPQPGGMTVRLKNVARKWEPLFGSNLIDTEQRFRLTLDGQQEGVWYTTDFQIEYPAGTGYSEVIITCSDGVEVLALDDLPELDPPDAQSYADVVSFDQPWGYWRLGETQTEAQAVTRVRTVTRGHGKNRRRIKRRQQVNVTTVSDSGTAGPAGVFQTRNLLALDQPGLILGDPDTCMLATRSGTSGGHVKVAIDDVELVSGGNAVTVEAWISVRTVTDDHPIVTGPLHSSGQPIWELKADRSGAAESLAFGLRDPGGGSVFLSWTETAPGGLPGRTYHVVGTWDGQVQRFYVNGENEGELSRGFALSTPAANPVLYIGRNTVGPEAFDGYIDEVAVYERALSAERVLAHYQAGAARGFPQQTAGARIAAIATSDLWQETFIQTTGRDVQPQMMFGQSRIEQIAELAHAEGPRTMFFFFTEDPIYLGHEWQATSSTYYSVQATFGDAGSEIPYQDVALVYDHETFNTVTASREGGPLITHTDTVEEGVRRRRVNGEYTDLLLANDDDVDSLAYHVLQLYKQPAMRPTTITVDGYHALTQTKDLDIGHLIRVKRRGADNVAIDRVCHIIGKRKHLDASRHLTCTYTLARGFDGATETAMAGISGYSAAGTAKAA